MTERWRPIMGGLYSVSDQGAVRRDGRKKGARVGRIRKPLLSNTGYLCAVLWDNRRQTQRNIHQLVAEAFIGPCPEGKEVNHKNCDKTDNRLENLEYVSPSENCTHAYVSGRRRTRLTAESVRMIRMAKPQGETFRALARRLGASESAVARAYSGATWAHVREGAR